MLAATQCAEAGQKVVLFNVYMEVNEETKIV